MSSPKLTRSNSLPANIGTGTTTPAPSPGHSGKAGKSSSHAKSHLMPHVKNRPAGDAPSSMAPRGGLSHLSGTKSRDLNDPFKDLESGWNAPPTSSLMDAHMHSPAFSHLDVYPQASPTLPAPAPASIEDLMAMQKQSALDGVAMQMAAAENNALIAQGQAAVAASEIQAKAAKSALESTKGLM